MPDAASTLAPMMLVSMPQMADPNFAQTVVLLCAYGPEGAFGLVLNRRMAQPANEVVETEPAIPIRDDIYLFSGGPVEPRQAWVLTSRPLFDGDATEVADGVYLTASVAALKSALQTPPQDDVRVLVGYAGWSPGQLDEELAQSAWLLVPVGADLIFSSHPGEMWNTAIRRLGADPAHLLGSSGVH